MLEEVFDRVFDGQDVTRAIAVAMVDHRRHGGRFSRPGGADDKYQPALFHDHVGKRSGQLEGFKGRNVATNETHYNGDAVALPKEVDAEIAQIPPPEGEVHLLFFLEPFRLLRRHDLVGHALDHLRFHLLLIDRQRFAFNLDMDRDAGGDEDVRCAFFGHQVEQLVENHCNASAV